MIYIFPKMFRINDFYGIKKRRYQNPDKKFNLILA